MHDENNSFIQNDTLNLHKTLKSILPHANISFGNSSNNIAANSNTNLLPNNYHANNLTNKNMQFNGLHDSRMPLQQQQQQQQAPLQQQQQHQQDQRSFWPDDPAIVSLTDRSHPLLNGTFNGLNGGIGNSFNELQYQLANNRSLSPSFLNNFANMNNINNKNQPLNNLKLSQRINGEQQQQQHQQQQPFLNNQYFSNFNKLDDLNNLAQPLLYRLHSFNNNLNGLNTNESNNTNNNNNSNANNLFATSLINEQLSQLVNNQDNSNSISLNMASLSLHQQFLLQQLTTNFAAKKLPSE